MKFDSHFDLRNWLPALIVLLTYGFGLWWYTIPFTGDEKVYVAISMEMWVQKSWLYPILFGEHNYLKPPFQYWVTLLGWHVFGFGSFGTYIPSVVATAGSVWLLSHIHALFKEEDSLMPSKTSGGPASSGLWFAGCIGALTYGLTAQMEIWIVFFYLLVWYLFSNFLAHKKWIWFYLALFFAGISGLVKSPLYSVFSVAGIWMYLALSRNIRIFTKIHFWLAHLIGIVAGGAWFLFVFISDRDRFLAQYFHRETLAKLMGNSSSPLRMWLHFTTFCVPIALFIIPVLLLTLYSPVKNLKSKNLLHFLISSTLAPAIFFSIFPYRTETYLFLLLPMVVLWIDQAVTAGQERKFLLLFSRLNSLAVFLFSLAASSMLYLGEFIPLSISLTMLVLSAVFVKTSWRLRWNSMALVALGLVLSIRLGGLWLGESDIGMLRQTVHQMPNRILAFYDEGRNFWNEIGLLSMGVGTPAKRCSNVDELVSHLKTGGLLVLTEDQESVVVPKIRSVFTDTDALEIIPWWRWRRGFGIPTLEDIVRLGNKQDPKWQEKNRRQFKILYLKSVA